MTDVLLKDVVLGSGRTKVIVSITGRTVAELVQQSKALSGHEFDVVEWRADFFEAVGDTEAVLCAGRQIVDLVGERPVLFTFRTTQEGGARPIEPADYCALNLAVIDAGLVEAVDVEHSLPHQFGEAVRMAAQARGVAVVGSFHDFNSTPCADAIATLLVAMARRGFDIVKVAVMPHDQGDVLALMEATLRVSTACSTPVLTVSMADLGAVSRVAAPFFGSCATFAAVGRPSAPGQIPVERLRPMLDLLQCRTQPGDSVSQGTSIQGAADLGAIALIGLSGAGKSTIGPLLAQRLGVPHHDVDRVIEQRQGRTIRQIFDLHGEPYFRALERDLTVELLGSPGVVSLGGGAPMTADVAAALATHPVVWLQVEPASAARRVKADDSRPLLCGSDAEDQLDRMLNERGPTYAGLASLVVDTDLEAPAAIVEAIERHAADFVEGSVVKP